MINLKIDKDKIKSLGGLFVIGTERMESRRVDNQARGRAGGKVMKEVQYFM